MSRSVPALIAVATVVVLVVASPLAVAAGIGGSAQTGATNATADDVTAGQRLAGVVGSEGAELDGTLRERSFGVALSRADSSAAKAGLVAETHGSLSDRLAQLRERKAGLAARYENGSLSRGEYQARLARLGAQLKTLTQMANRTSSAARDLPAQALEARGVNVTALEALRRNAANLSGPEVAAAARNLTRGGPPGDLGSGERPGAANPGQGPPDNTSTSDVTSREEDAERDGAGNASRGERNGTGAPDGSSASASDD